MAATGGALTNLESFKSNKASLSWNHVSSIDCVGLLVGRQAAVGAGAAVGYVGGYEWE